jgi:RNA polymerase sigma-70 factor (ECF subfamily)
MARGMAGADKELAAGGRTLYCVLPRELAPKLQKVLRGHFRDDAIDVLVERRLTTRRTRGERRVGMAPGPGGEERRRITNSDGRRVGSRRAATLAVDAPVLPRRARSHAEQLVFIERLAPTSRQIEDLDTARLLTRIQAGDRELFAEVYMRYFDRLYGYLRIVFKDPHSAEDAAQHVFVRVLEELGRFDPGRGTFRSWLFVIARHHALTQLGSSGRADLLEPTEMSRLQRDTPAAAELDALDWVSDRELHLFIERLPLAQRQVLFLRYVVGMSTAETAGLLEASADVVRQHHARALGRLRARLNAVGRCGKQSDRVGSHILTRRLLVVRARRYALASSGPTR